MLVLQMRKYCEKTIFPELAGSYLPAVADKHRKPCDSQLARTCVIW